MKQDSQPPLSRTLAKLILSADERVLDGYVVEAIQRSLLDGLGCTLGASHLSQSTAILNHFRSIGGVAEADVIGMQCRLPAATAAMVNGAMAHGLDFDEGHTSAGSHPGSVILPAALAIGQRQEAAFAKVMVAIVVGYEVMLRLALAIHPQSARAGWHNTGIAGVFGAAAAASYLLGLSEQQIAGAFGIALSFSSGTLQYQDNGADTKRLHAGKAAHDGILAAQLALSGLLGPDLSLEGRFGFSQLFGQKDFSTEQMLQGFLAPPLITTTYFKPFAGNRHLHAALDAILHLRNQHGLAAESIKDIQIYTYSSGVIGHTDTIAANQLSAQSSLPIMAAIVLLEGNATPATIERHLQNSRTEALARKISAIVDPACDALYPQERSARVAINLTDGRNLHRSVTGPIGEHDNPLSQAELQRKFRLNTADILPEPAVEALIQRIANCRMLQTVDDLLADISALSPRSAPHFRVEV